MSIQTDSASDQEPEPKDMKLALMDPSGPPVDAPTPWGRACKGAITDVDFLKTTRRPSWFGGCGFCVFVLLFMVLAAVELTRPATYSMSSTSSPTSYNPYTILFYCGLDSPNGNFLGGVCNYTIAYNKQIKVPSNNTSGGSQYIFQPNPCAKYNAVGVIDIGYMFQLTVCYSDGINDGLFLMTTPGKSSLEIWEGSGSYPIPQESGGQTTYILSRTQTTYTNKSAFVSWHYQPMSLVVTNESTSTTHIRLSDVFVENTQSVSAKGLSFGEVGGIAFLVWVVLRFLADIHWRCTKPYAGVLFSRYELRQQAAAAAEATPKSSESVGDGGESKLQVSVPPAPPTAAIPF